MEYNLATGSATGQGTDSLSNIENINGSNYDDRLIGNGGTNILDGKSGNDTLNGGLGNDILMGGGGVDQASYEASPIAVTVNLSISKAQNTVGAGKDTLVGIENLLGSNFGDNLTGDALDNVLEGGSGDDLLSGSLGNDVIIGGLGRDVMTGGEGIDTFTFNSINESTGVNTDVITDFKAGVDKLDLSAIDANVFASGNQGFLLISSDVAFSSAGQVKFTQGNVFAEVTGDGVADFQITLTGVISLGTNDIVL